MGQVYSYVSSEAHKVKLRHYRKLRNLIEARNASKISFKTTKFYPKFVNCSDVDFSLGEVKFLSKELKHNASLSKADRINLLVSGKKLLDELKKFPYRKYT